MMVVVIECGEILATLERASWIVRKVSKRTRETREGRGKMPNNQTQKEGVILDGALATKRPIFGVSNHLEALVFYL